MTKLQIWLLAIRPKTLPAAAAPVLMGIGMALGDGFFHWISAGITLLAACAIQIGTNLANDYFDYQQGADTQDRLGPIRVTQAGLVKPVTIKIAFVFVFILAALLSFYLIQRAGWPILIILIFSILFGIFYTAGPYSLAYLGLGEFFVLIFFGPVAVGGTYYIQSLEMNPAVILAGLAPGLFSTAILTINNLRDVATDQKAGKKTLAVRFGKEFALNEYLFSILGGSLTPVLIFFVTRDYTYSLIAVCVALWSIPTIRIVLTKTDGASLNDALANTGRLLLVYSVLFSIGWIL